VSYAAVLSENAQLITTLHALHQTVYYSLPTNATLCDLAAKAARRHVAEMSEHNGCEYECGMSLLEIH